jgi:hypothetical protein
MRVWSLHPKHLDVKGLCAQWREALLAQKVLQGETKGWRNHPQLTRFKNHQNSVDAIGYYLAKIHEESVKREYNFNKSKILAPYANPAKIKITGGQLDYEFRLLMSRLKKRAFEKYHENKGKEVAPHPLFVIIDGDIEPWETGYWKSHQRS